MMNGVLLKALAVAGAVAVILLVTGCGGDDGPLERDSLAEAADEVCAEFEARFARAGNIGQTNAQIADEITHSTELAIERQERLRDLEFTPDVAEEWEEFLGYGDRFIEVNRDIVRAARADETGRVSAGFNRLIEPASQRRLLAEELGMEVCGSPGDPEVEETGIEPPDDLPYTAPVNTAEEVVEEMMAAVAEEDCDRLGATAHSHLGWFDEGVCAEIFTNFGGADLLATEEHGPAAVAEIESELGDRYTLVFVTGDGDEYRYAGHAQNEDRGLRPANEEADPDRTAEILIAALAEEDIDRRQEVLADRDSDPVPLEMAVALAEGADAEISLLALNQALAVHQIEIDGEPYIVVYHHMPGGNSEYLVADVIRPAHHD